MSIVMGAAPAFADNHYLTPVAPGKVALVIGNSDYANLPDIPSSREDAIAVADTLRSLGFEVHQHLNVKDFREFEDVILPAFRSSINSGDFVVFYFSGHGFTHGPHNMLAYTDQPLTVKSARLAIDALSVEAIEDLLVKREPGLLLFILDACRSIAGFVVEERDGSRAIAKGLNAPSGYHANAINIMTAFATRPGAVAGGTATAGQMSVFTDALVKNVTNREADFNRLFNRISTEVIIETNEEQQPGLHDYSRTDPWLDPPTQIVDQEKEAWQSALSSGEHKSVRAFLSLNSVSHYAHAARTWLQNNANENHAARFTRVSPAVVERAWMPSIAGDTVSVTRLEAPVAFERTLSAEASDELRSVSRSDLGVIETAADTDSSAPDIATSLDTLARYDVLVAASNLVAREAPSFDAEPVRIKRQTRLNFDRAVQSLQLAVNPDPVPGPDTRQTVWLKAQVASQNAVYVPVEAKQLRPIRLGRALREFTIPRRKNAPAGLVDKEAVAAVVAETKRKYRSITWVSMATAETSDNEEADARLAQLANTRLLLTKAGIDSKRITAVEGAPDYTGDGVRLRFFGY